MKLNLRPVIAGAAVLAITGGVLAGTVGTAAAATTPPWEPDPNSLGSLTLYDAGGNVVTGGNNLTHLFDYAQASTADANTGIKATLFFATPAPSTPTGSFTSGQASASSFTPPTAAGTPPALTTSSTPVATSGATGANLSNYSVANPAGSAAGFANIYQVRLVTTGGDGGSSGNGQYWEDDVQIDPTAGTWSVIYPAAVQATGTTLSASPNPTDTATPVTLTATETETGVSPAAHAPGSVDFTDGATDLGSAAVNTTTGVATLTHTFGTVATHSLTATFTPTDPTSFGGSSGATSLTVGPVATHTSTALTVSQDGTVGDDVNFSATVSPSAAPGTVSFYDNGSSTALNSSPVAGSGGTYTFDLPSGLPAGSHSIVAKFTPTDPTAFEGSASSPQTFTLQAAQVGACLDSNSACTDVQTIEGTIPVGTLVISTPYTPTNPLNLGTLSLNGTATEYTATAAFSNIVVTDNRSGGLGWTAQALSSDLTDGESHPNSTIDAQNVGLTNLVESQTAGDTATVALTPNPAADPAVAPGAPGSAGLGTTPHTFATSTVGAGQVGDGTVGISGVLTLNAPTSTEAGLFTGTITFTVG